MSVRTLIGGLFGQRSESSVREQETVETNPGAVVADFLAALGDRNVDKAFSAVADDADVSLPAADVEGKAADAREFFRATVDAFPDLVLHLKRTVETSDGVVAVELKFEGTQGADWLGIVNQEKHLDVDQSWLFRVQDGRIRTIHGYWCQNQVYRRLAVRRIDQPAIV